MERNITEEQKEQIINFGAFDYKSEKISHILMWELKEVEKLIKDKKSETAMLMRNKLNDMAKKLKGKKSIPMLPEGKAHGGMANKKRMGSMDYRKGGMILIALDFKKKKGK